MSKFINKTPFVVRILIVFSIITVVSLIKFGNSSSTKIIVDGEQNKSSLLEAKTTSFDPNLWKNHCLEYHTWFKAFSDDLSMPRRRQKWSGDKDLKKIINLLEMALNSNIKIDPIQIAGIEDNYRSLTDKPSPNAKVSEAFKQTKNANELVKQVKQILVNKQRKVEKFISALHQKYARLGWDGPVRIVSMIKGMFPQNSQEISGEITKILDNYFEFKDRLEKIDELSDELQIRQEIIVSSGDKILMKVGEYITGQLNDLGNLEEFTRQLRVLTSKEHVLTKLAGFVKNEWTLEQINLELFELDSNIHRYFNNQINEDMLTAWLNDVHEYFWLDKRRITTIKNGWIKDLDRIRENLQWLSDIKIDKVDGFEAELTALVKASDLDVPYIKKYDEVLERLIESTDRKIKNLGQNVELKKITHSENPCDWLENIKSFKPEYSPILKETWFAKIQAIQSSISCATLNADPNDYANLRGSVDRLQRFLIDLEEAFPSSFNIIIPKPKIWHRGFFDYIKAKKEEVLTNAISLVEWQNNSPNMEFKEIVTEKNWTTLYDRYHERFVMLRRVFLDFQTIENKLDMGYFPGEESHFESNESTIKMIYNSWQNNIFIKQNPEIEKILKPVFSRIHHTEKILEDKNVERLVENALDSKVPFVQILASWRRLSKIDWPLNSADREKMKRIYTRLVGLANTLDDDGRIAELQGQLNQEKAVCELNFFDITIKNKMNETKSFIDKLRKGKPAEKSRRLDEIEKDFEELGQLKKNKEQELVTRKPHKRDIAILSKLLIRLYHVRKKIIEESDPWEKIRELEKLDKITDDHSYLNEIWFDWRAQTLSNGNKEDLKPNYKDSLQLNLILKNGFNMLNRLVEDIDFNRNISENNSNLMANKWKDEIVILVRNKRKEMIRESLTKDINFSANSIKDKFESWRDVLNELAAKFYLILSHLDSGFTLHNNLLNGTLDSFYERGRIQHSSYPELTPILSPVMDRMNRLRSIDNVSGRDLIGELEKEKSHLPEILMTMWAKTRLLEDWPRTVDELKQEVKLRKQIEKIISAPINKKGFRPISRKNEFDGEKEKRWLICAQQMAKNDDLEKVIALKKHFLTHTDQLDSNTQFNLILYEIKRAVFGDSNDSKIVDFCQEFINKFRKKVDIADPEVTDFLNKLEKTISGDATAYETAFEDIGPGSSVVSNELVVNTMDNGRIIECTWANSVLHKNSFRFIRIEPTGAVSKPFYLCSTEVSFGLFLQVITFADKSSEISAFIPEKAGDHTRPGPWVWDYDNKQKRISPRVDWVNTPSIESSKGYYAQSQFPENPSTLHPMHQISPHLAVYFSTLLGCRLPSPEEWKLANKLHENLEKRNLRGRAWKQQNEHVIKLNGIGKNVFYPDYGIFWPSIPSKELEKIGRDAETHDSSDGILWFDHIDSQDGEGFSHLQGNVAEYVFEMPEVYDKEFRIRAHNSVKNINQFVERQISNFFVIGGSALSPPHLKLTEAYPVNNLKQQQGYSDIGLRLAFTAPGLTLRSRIQAAVEDQDYLFN